MTDHTETGVIVLNRSCVCAPWPDERLVMIRTGSWTWKVVAFNEAKHRIVDYTDDGRDIVEEIVPSANAA